MLNRQFARSRMTTATRRRIAALALARTNRYGPRTIATPSLVAAAPDEHAKSPDKHLSPAETSCPPARNVTFSR
jgi:hypothetical protein